MENEVFNKLKILVEALTHSGSSALDEDIFKEVKKICKLSENNIPHVYNLVFKELCKNNSQIRLSAFQICKELFKRSALFRENALRDLHLIFELATEINTAKKLPPPKSSAERLKCLAIATLKTWVEEFGETHKKLAVAYNYFEKCKKVNFETFQVGNSADQMLENEQQRHLRVIREEKIKRVFEEFSSNESEIETTLISLSNCLSLLLPPAEEFFIPEHNLQKICSADNASISNINFASSSSKSSNTFIEDENEDNEYHLLSKCNNLREYGISSSYNLSLQLNLEDKFKIVKTEDNSSIIENAEDYKRLIKNKFLPMVKKWINVYCKCSDRSSNNIKKIINLKEKLENILKKYNLLIIDNECGIKNEDSDSEDDEFEEVKKEGYEEAVICYEEILKKVTNSGNTMQSAESGGSSKDLVPSGSQDSSVSGHALGSNRSEPSLSDVPRTSSPVLDRKRKLLLVAPKLPYDIDLYHWEDEKLSVPTLISTKIDVDKFWGSAGSDDIHEIPNPEGIAALRTRVIEYSGTFVPVKWACRAPMPNGKLCPRKDRFKCPFHGKIVPRDQGGNVQSKDDNKTSNKTTEQCGGVQDFQEREFLRDLEAATGVDLTKSEKRGKKRKSQKKNLTHKKMKTSAAALKIVESKKLPGLVDVVKRQNNAYTRLSKKVFNRSSSRRVSAVLNKLDRNKFRDKFGDQFNYS